MALAAASSVTIAASEGWGLIGGTTPRQRLHDNEREEEKWHKAFAVL